jgi:hypothetical protein
MKKLTVTLCPARLRETAAAKPAIPAPTTMTSNSIFAIANLQQIAEVTKEVEKWWGLNYKNERQ